MVIQVTYRLSDEKQMYIICLVTENVVDGSDGIESACNSGDLCSIPGLGKSPGKGKGYPLQYSGPENSGLVAKSRKGLSDFQFHFPAAWARPGVLRFPGDRAPRRPR